LSGLKPGAFEVNYAHRMAMHARAAILSIGDELTLGQSLDTNSQWLSQRLAGMGVLVVEHSTVPDDEDAIIAVLRRLSDPSSRVHLIVSTGGLGPTLDDLTRSALAGVMREPLVEDAGALRAIESWFTGRGRVMPHINRVQALRPASARVIDNPRGTAPGLACRLRGECDAFCLPGPPGEMKAMFEASVLPALRVPPDRVLITRMIQTFGLGESEIAERLGPIMDRDRNPLVGTTASGGHVACRIRFDGDRDQSATQPEAMQKIDETEERIRSLLGAYALGVGELNIPHAAFNSLRIGAQTLSVAESCTGGMLGSFLTEVPGASAVFLGGFITYSNEMKSSLLGVPPDLFKPGSVGAVSRECAEAMARGCLARAGSDHALSITGIAGPDGGTAEKPVGAVWVCVASRQARMMMLESRRFLLGPGREAIRDWSAKLALAMLRFRLLGETSAPLLREQERHAHVMSI
jgi:nicotinamide-nucleotide amidase